MNLKNLIFLIVSLYLTYPFLIKGLVIPLQVATYGGGFYLIIKYFNILNFRVRQARNCNLLKKLSVYIILLIISSIIFPILHSSFDFSYLTTSFNELKCLVRMLTIYILACIIYKKNISNLDYFKIFISVNCIYVFSTCIFLLIPGLRDFWNSIIISPAADNIEFDVMEYITRYGLQGFSGFINTGFCTIAVVFNIYIIEINRRLKQSNRNRILILLLLLVGNMFYGRIGLIISLVLSLSYIAYLIILKGRINVLIYCTIFISLLVFAIYLFVMTNDSAQIWFNWAYEPMINYFSGNGFESASSNRLKEMWALPSFSTIALGDGFYTDPVIGNYYKHTDVGYMRNIYNFGIIPTIFCILSYICCAKCVQPKSLRCSIDNTLIATLIMVGLIIEAKGEFILFASGVLFPLFFTYKYNHKLSNT